MTSDKMYSRIKLNGTFLELKEKSQSNSLKKQGVSPTTLKKILKYERLIVFIKNLSAIFKDKVCLVKIYRFCCATFDRFL
jgi:hypothetical protein